MYCIVGVFFLTRSKAQCFNASDTTDQTFICLFNIFCLIYRSVRCGETSISVGYIWSKCDQQNVVRWFDPRRKRSATKSTQYGSWSWSTIMNLRWQILSKIHSLSSNGGKANRDNVSACFCGKGTECQRNVSVGCRDNQPITVQVVVVIARVIRWA